MKAINLAYGITFRIAVYLGMFTFVWIGLFVEVDTHLYVPMITAFLSAVFSCIAYMVRRYGEWKVAEDYRMAHYFHKYNRHPDDSRSA